MVAAFIRLAAVRHARGALAGDTERSVGLATEGTVYFGWDNGEVAPMIAVSTDKGLHWSNPLNVGAALIVRSLGGACG